MATWKCFSCNFVDAQRLDSFDLPCPFCGYTMIRVSEKEEPHRFIQITKDGERS